MDPVLDRSERGKDDESAYLSCTPVTQRSSWVNAMKAFMAFGAFVILCLRMLEAGEEVVVCSMLMWLQAGMQNRGGEGCNCTWFDNALVAERRPIEALQVRMFSLPWQKGRRENCVLR